MSERAVQAVLEQILTVAIDGARDARKRASQDRFEDGRLMAYYDMITWAQTQAKLMGVEFSDKSLASFDADKELLRGKKRAA